MNKRLPFSPEDLQIMRDYYPVGGVDLVRQHLPNRSEYSIRAKAGGMSLMLRKGARKPKSKSGGRPAIPVRKPFDDVPEEYVAVSSIWQVGYLCHAKESTKC